MCSNEDPKPMRCSKSSSKTEVYSNTILSQETRKISDKQPNLYLKELEKEEQNPKVVEEKNHKDQSRNK